MRHLSVIALFLFLVSCDYKQASFERSNPNDPRGTSFSPRENASFTAVLHRSGVVRLQWQAADIVIDGFTIERKNQPDDTFQTIATVAADSTWIDDEGPFNAGTSYRVSSFILLPDKVNIYQVYEAELSTTAFFQSGLAFISASGEVRINWQFRAPIIDQIRISAPFTLNGTQQVVRIAQPDTMAFFADDLNDFSFDSRTYTMNYRKAFGNDTLTLRTDTLVFNTRQQLPITGFTVTPVHERRWEIEWNTLGRFAQSYTLHRLNPVSQQFELVQSFAANELSFVDAIVFGEPGQLNSNTLNAIRTYRVVAQYDGTESTPSQLIRSIAVPPVQQVRLNREADTQTNTSFRLEWSHLNSSFVDSFLIELSAGAQVQRFYADKNARSITLSNLDQTSYSASVFTYTTARSSAITIRQVNADMLNSTWQTSSQVDANDNITKLIPHNDLLYYKGEFSSGIDVFNTSTQTSPCTITDGNLLISDFALLTGSNRLVYLTPETRQIKTVDLPCGGNLQVMDQTPASITFLTVEASSNGDFILLSDEDGSVLRRYSTTDNSISYSISLSSSVAQPLAFALNAASTEILVNTSNTLVRYNAQTGAVLSSYTSAEPLRPYKVGFTADGTHVFAVLSNRVLYHQTSTTAINGSSYLPIEAYFAVADPIDTNAIIVTGTHLSLRYAGSNAITLLSLDAIPIPLSLLRESANHYLIGTELGSVHRQSVQSTGVQWIDF